MIPVMKLCDRSRAATLALWLSLLIGFIGAASAAVPPASAHRFEIAGGKFLLDGKPFVIVAGEMHYPRIPRAYWRHRMRMAKAMGLNTIATYVFWNVHEPEKGRFLFRGDADLAAFVRTAREEGLYVILRPGPYVCAEWEFGGFPYWLLTETTDGKPGGQPIRIRSRDEKFLQYASRYLKRVGEQTASLQADRGGNILMVQVENEYGSFESDKVYMGRIRDAVRAAGFTVPLFTADGPSQMPAGHLDGVLPALNGVVGPEVIKVIDGFQKGGPYFAPEVYPGWLDHWGEPFYRSNPTSGAKALEWFVRNGHSISLYMFHGGTNFGFFNGANYGASFEPHTTTYDYSAPLDEAGRPTEQFRKMRETLQSLLPSQPIPDVPATNPVISIPRFALERRAALFSTLPHYIASERPLTMEQVDQAYGYILYRARVKGPIHDRLTVRSVRDYAIIYANGRRLGVLDRRRKQQSIDLDLPGAECTLDILVENGGRINYGGQLRDNRKGITEAVLLGDSEVRGWQIYSLPMSNPDITAADTATSEGPILYGGQFEVDAPGDTFLDMRGWTKGAVWVNGHALGRYWNIGPQQTLYVPGPWLKSGVNRITVLEMLDTGAASVEGLKEPVLDQLVPEPPIAGHPARPRLAVKPTPTEAELAAAGEFPKGEADTTVRFARKQARYICLESLSAQDASDWASCAELYLFGPDEQSLPRGRWRILYADSEEDAGEDGAADNMIDEDVATIWHSLWSRPYPGHPHRVVIDLGEERAVTGFRYVPRSGDKPGKIARYRFYTSLTPFGAR